MPAQNCVNSNNEEVLECVDEDVQEIEASRMAEGCALKCWWLCGEGWNSAKCYSTCAIRSRHHDREGVKTE